MRLNLVRPSRLWQLSAAALLLLGSLEALAAGTAAGITVSNQARVDYEVATVAQEFILSDPNGNSVPGAGSGAQTTDFLVDNRVDFTLVETGFIGATTVTPNQLNNVTEFLLTNTGNSTQDYRLVPSNLGIGVIVNGNSDTDDMNNLRAFADTDASGDWTPADLGYVDELAADGQILIFIVADADTVPALVNGDVANVELLAVTADAGTALTLGPDTTDDSGSADDPAAVDVVFADDGLGVVGDGQETAQDGYIVSSAALVITKTQQVISDPFNLGVNPKAIPGATVEYTITVQNTGASNADSVQISDIIDTTNLTLVLGAYGGDDVEITDGGVVSTCTADAPPGDGDGCSFDGTTLVMGFAGGLTVETTAPDDVTVFRFRVTIN